jgi:hypothetical protein
MRMASQHVLAAMGMIVGSTYGAPVQMNIFYEADCPFSEGFIANELGPLYGDATGTCVKDRVEFDFFPYGMATNDGVNVNCQHGKDECYGNRLAACAKNRLGGNKDAMTRYVICFETQLLIPGKLSRSPDINNQCAGEAGLNAQELEGCANGPEGHELLIKIGARTSQGQPQQAPWAVFAKYPPPGSNAQGSLVLMICNVLAEENQPLPACCSQGATAPARRLLV